VVAVSAAHAVPSLVSALGQTQACAAAQQSSCWCCCCAGRHSSVRLGPVRSTSLTRLSGVPNCGWRVRLRLRRCAQTATGPQPSRVASSSQPAD